MSVVSDIAVEVYLEEEGLMKRYFMMMLVAIAAFALLGAACGGGGDDSGANADPTSAADSGDDSEDSGNGDSNDPDDSGDGDSSDSGDSGDGDSDDSADSGDSDDADSDAGDGGLAAVVSAASALSGENSYKVTYQIKSEGGSDGVLNGTFTLASDPPRQLFRIQGTFDGEELNMTMITDEDSTILCVEGDEPGVCFSLGVAGASPIPMPAFFDAPTFIGTFTTADGVNVSPAGSDNIAGQSATCYNVNSDEGDAKICVADDGGQLLSVQVQDGEMTFEMIVIEFGSPSDDDFEPPFAVIDFG